MKQRILPPLVFAVLACCFLLIGYSDMLLSAQLHTPYMAGELFRSSISAEPFGWMSYLGCWMTQHFYYPVVGVLLLAAIWLVTWLAGARAFALGKAWSILMVVPLGCLLLSLTDVGYWIYCLKLFGYWFSQSLGYLCCLLLLCVMLQLRRGVVWHIVQALACIVLYPVIGWYAYLLAACLLLVRYNFWTLAVVFAPALWQQTLFPDKSMYVMWVAGFPVFENNSLVSLRPSIPFIVLVVATLLLSLWPKLLRLLRLVAEPGMKQWSLVTAVLALVMGTWIWFGSFRNYNYQAEMRMIAATMNDDWRGVIAEAQKSRQPSRTMVALKNVALMNTGQLGSKSYVLGNDGIEIYNPDSLSLNIMHIASPLVYYNFGKVNYAYRWCVESAVAYGYSPFMLATMTRCAQASGEAKLALRNQRLLQGMTYYHDWQPKPTTPMVAQLREAFGNVIDSDNNNCERYLIETFSNSFGSDYAVVRELNLFFAMLYGDPKRFWPAFVAYAADHRNEALPQSYQEAYYYFMEHYPVDLPFKVNVAKLNYDSYKAFLQHYAYCQQSGANKATMGEAMREKWGKTYWWHQFFGRNTY